MRAQLRLELKNKDGKTLEVRHAHNAVMRAGAQLVADLFAGKGTPITHVGVGTSDAPETDAYATEALSNEPLGDLEPLKGDTAVAIPPEAFLPPEIDEKSRVVRVRLRSTLPADAAIGTLREAGLIARNEKDEAILYNRVTFSPITKGDDHELTMFWEVSFPYGDLPWLM
jgi:hypothetical protein